MVEWDYQLGSFYNQSLCAFFFNQNSVLGKPREAVIPQPVKL